MKGTVPVACSLFVTKGDLFQRSNTVDHQSEINQRAWKRMENRAHFSHCVLQKYSELHCVLQKYSELPPGAVGNHPVYHVLHG